MYYWTSIRYMKRRDIYISIVQYCCTTLSERDEITVEFEGVNAKLNQVMDLVVKTADRLRELERFKVQMDRESAKEKAVSGELTQDEKNILEYISDHPNSTKQNVVDHFKGQIARTPVFNTIENLVRYDIVKDSLDPKNRQAHRLIINSDSVFLKVLQDLGSFETYFIQLLQRIKEEHVKAYTSIDNELESKWNLKKRITLQELESVQKNPDYFEVTKYVHTYPIMFHKPIRVFREVEQAYIIRSISEWPLKIREPRLLNKLFSMCFNRLLSIQLKMINIILESPFFKPDDYDTPSSDFVASRDAIITKGVVVTTQNTDPTQLENMGLKLDDESLNRLPDTLGGWHDFDKTREYFKQFGIDEIEPVIKSLLDITYDLQSTTDKSVKQAFFSALGKRSDEQSLKSQVGGKPNE